MDTIDFNTDLPSWAHKVNNEFQVQDLHTLFRRQKGNSSAATYISLDCSDKCGAKIDLSYYGLNHFLPGEHGNDESLQFRPQYPEHKTKDTADNITVDLTKDGVLESLDTFLSNMKKAMAFKEGLKKGILFYLQFRLEKEYDVGVIVRKDIEDSRIVFLLLKLDARLNKVPLLVQAENYRNCLGIIHTLGLDADIESIQAGRENKSDNPVLERIFWWMNILLKANGRPRTITEKPYLWVLEYLVRSQPSETIFP